MELYSAARIAHRPVDATDLARYLERLPLAAEQRAAVLRTIATSLHGAAGEGASAATAMAQLHQVLGALAAETAESGANPAAGAITGSSDDPASASLAWRLQLACGGAVNAARASRQRDGRARLNPAPTIERTPMAPHRWPYPGIRHLPLVARLGAYLARRRARAQARAVEQARTAEPMRGSNAASRAAEARPDATTARNRWQTAGTVRRVVLLALIVAQTWIASNYMAAVLPYHGDEPLEMGILALFAILFGWVSAGFWTALMGFALLVSGRDRYAITQRLAQCPPIAAQARTAIVMPICNENVARVFAGLRATYESVARAGALPHCDFFALSDTSDPDLQVAELDGWLALCRAVDGFGRVFYRRRHNRIKRKSGNVADFCRRWGARYRYMVVLDADSVMSGACIKALVQLMEAHPQAGIIQTAPLAAGRSTLFARMQQFATRVYGPVFTAGLHYWQLGESHYWGHNAIIRVAPFTRYCALGRLPGSGSMSGEILSHDFVEAALMRRAGWAVWIAYDLPGSYEEMPPNLGDELKRDRRWCQGNLMNFRLFRARGLHPAHRAVFVTGVLAYVSAPLWFLSLLLSTALVAQHALVAPRYFRHPNQLFPLWPEWHPQWAMALFGTTFGLLFMPKVLAVLRLSFDPSEARRYGGALRLNASAAAETVFSAVLAPIRMLFHTRFVVGTLLGRSSSWQSPPRDDAQTPWSVALRQHGAHALLGVAWVALVYWLNPAFVWWLLPVGGALIISVAVDVYTSRARVGLRARAAGLFVIPEETQRPQELADTYDWIEHAAASPGFSAAVVDPLTNALVCAAGVSRVAHPGTRVAADGAGSNPGEASAALVEAALAGGPAALSAQQRTRLLNHSLALSQLHFLVWSDAAANPAWRDLIDEQPPAPAEVAAQ